MALLFMDGFGGNDMQYKWDNGSSIAIFNSASPRVPGGYYALISGNRFFWKSVTPSAQLFVGIGISSETTCYVTFQGDSGATSHISVIRNGTTGIMEVRRGTSSGTLLATGTQPLYDLTWNYIEMSVTIADSGGNVRVRLNGQTTDEINFTGDTRNGGTSTNIDRIYLYGSNASLVTYASDLYILNSTGSAPTNTFLGDVAVRTLAPSSNGTDSQLTGSDGDQVNNYLLVDERPYASADYTGGSTPGIRDTYGIADLTAGINTVYGIQINGSMAKSDVSLGTAKLMLRTGGNLFSGTTRALGTTFVTYSELYPINPNTVTNWTVSDVNGLEAGMEVV